MKALAYALLGCLLVIAPTVAADWNPIIGPSERVPGWPHCMVLGYQLDPPYIYKDPTCLFPLPP